MIKNLKIVFLLFVLCCSSIFALETSDEKYPNWVLQTSCYTRHYNYNPNHNNHQHLVGIEYQVNPQDSFGLVYFKNSFYQDSQFLFKAYQWKPFKKAPSILTKLRVGFIHGYKGEHKDDLSLNKYGTAPVVVPSIGFSGKTLITEVSFLGNAAYIVQIGFKL